MLFKPAALAAMPNNFRLDVGIRWKALNDLHRVLMKNFKFLLLLLVLFIGCKSRQSNSDVVSSVVHPPLAIDENAPHVIFFTDGYVYDTLVMVLNDSMHLNTVINTDELAGRAKVISIHDHVIHTIKLKSVNVSNVIADTIYKPLTNYKWLFISKDGNTFRFWESELRPQFR